MAACRMPRLLCCIRTRMLLLFWLTALFGGGGCRALALLQAPGNITVAQVMSMLPYANAVSIFSVSGQVLIDAVKNGLSLYPSGGRFLQVRCGPIIANPSDFQVRPACRVQVCACSQHLQGQRVSLTWYRQISPGVAEERHNAAGLVMPTACGAAWYDGRFHDAALLLHLL